VNRGKTVRKDIADLEEVMKVCHRVVSAGEAIAPIVNRSSVTREFFAANIQRAAKRRR